MKFKVGDWLVRKSERRTDYWIQKCYLMGLNYAGPVQVMVVDGWGYVGFDALQGCEFEDNYFELTPPSEH